MTEKTPGQIAYEASFEEFYFQSHPGIAWHDQSPQTCRAWERTIEKASAPLLKRIAELEAAITSCSGSCHFGIEGPWNAAADDIPDRDHSCGRCGHAATDLTDEQDCDGVWVNTCRNCIESR